MFEVVVNFLVGDGTAFQDYHWTNTAAFAATTGPDRPEVVPIFAEYRQDWLAVAAGDRPVRTVDDTEGTAAGAT